MLDPTGAYMPTYQVYCPRLHVSATTVSPGYLDLTCFPRQARCLSCRRPTAEAFVCTTVHVNDRRGETVALFCMILRVPLRYERNLVLDEVVPKFVDCHTFRALLCA